jgi:hypothetical protein
MLFKKASRLVKNNWNYKKIKKNFSKNTSGLTFLKMSLYFIVFNKGYFKIMILQGNYKILKDIRMQRKILFLGKFSCMVRGH